MATVPKQHLIIPQGETYKVAFTWVDEDDAVIDNTAYTGSRMQIRQYHDSTTTEVSLTVGDGLTLGGADGVIQVEIPAETTAAWTWSSGYYDLEMVIPGTPEDVTRAVEGRVRVTPEVTR
jgi:hypothetical protein